MEMQELVNIITDQGFSIAVCIYMMYYIRYLDEKNASEVEKLRDALNNNTLIMQKLLNKLGGDDGI